MATLTALAALAGVILSAMGPRGSALPAGSTAGPAPPPAMSRNVPLPLPDNERTVEIGQDPAAYRAPFWSITSTPGPVSTERSRFTQRLSHDSVMSWT